MYERILVPTDGSEHAERALETAFAVARECGAAVHALFVVDTAVYGEPALSSVELVLHDVESEGEQLLAEVRGRAGEHRIESSVEARHGDPLDVILDYAAEIDADLIVMGGQGRTHEIAEGTVVTRVVEASDRHVLVV